VAAAVVLDPRCGWDGVNDSKRLTPEAREAIYARVLCEARAFAWAVVGPRSIDVLNIRRASLEAMRRAVVRLRLEPDLVLVDGNDRIPGLACRQEAVISGDSRLLSVAAASVVAKVVRDRIMERLDRVWPDYGFARHKGYGTPEHLAALQRHGPCPLHRYSFAPVRVQTLPLVGRSG
jgi:ribonuclease HII